MNASMVATKKGDKVSPNKTQGFDPDKSGALLEDDDRVIVTNYVCDFGNMVVGSTKKKTFRITNCGKNSLNFSFDTRILQQIGIAIDPSKPPKQFAPNSSMQFNVVFTTRKNAKHKKVKHIVPIHLSYGPSYTIEFVANLTIPELSMSTDTVEFNKVCVGTRKIIRVRFENKKEVPCDWSYYYKADVAGVSAKEGEKFSVWPTSGYLLPGQKQTVDVIFIPTHEKVVNQKLQFKVKENSKLFALNVKGHGINYALDIVGNSIEAGPVLPYDKSAVQVVELRNPMAFPIEVYSADFDKLYIEEEDILKRYEPLNTEKGDVIYEKLRKAGQEFWPNIREADEKRRQYLAMVDQLKAIEEKLEKDFIVPEPEEGKEPEPLSSEKIQEKNILEKEKAEIEQKIMEFDADKNVQKKAKPKVKRRDRLSVIIYGPEKSGKSTIAYFLSEEQQRGVVSLTDLLSWCEKNNTPSYPEVAKYLEERDEECKAQEELEKKKKKKKDGEEEFDPKIYKYLPREMLIKLIRERTDHEDCNAGIVFDNLLSENWKDEKDIINAICDALEEENVHLLLIALNKGEDGLEYCENYRYQMRKHIDDKTIDKEPLDKTFVEKEKSDKKGAKRGKKKELTEEEKKEQEDKKKQAEEEEKVKAMREEEEKKRLDEPEPKQLTDEEKQEYENRYQELIELFTEINLRQMNQRHEFVAEGEGDEAKEGEKEAEEKKEENKDIKEIEEDEKVEGEGDAREGEPQEAKPEAPYFGTRILHEVPLQYNFRYLCEKVKENIPEPLWPDPDKEPLPAPVIQQIIKKPANRPEKPKITLFSIWTPVDKKPKAEVEEVQEESKPDPKAKGKKDAKGGKAKDEPKEVEGEGEEEKGPFLDNNITRWILQPNEAKPLYIKFFSTKVGKFNQTLNFEVVGSTRQFPLEIKALCEFPTINTNPKNVFTLQKRQRPPAPPESYLQKCFITSENVFDFGPLLVGKDAEKRNDDEALKKANSTIFRITNNGKYDLNAKFSLESSLVSDEPPAGKSPFIFEPETMSLKVEETQDLTVWCFPEENKVYNDKIIALIKDNPNPAIFNVSCTGAKPIVKIDNPLVQFDRLLLKKPSKRTLKLTNDCQIPVKWTLKTGDNLPPEYTISKTDGVLKPCQDVDIEITFVSERQDQFLHKLVLEVEDTEGYNIKQQPQEIQLQAEAFDITVDIDVKNEENFMDFGAVRVGEPKEKKLTLTNKGKYPVKYGFNMKKKTTREIFTIEPSEGVLQPQEVKDIVVRFESQKEFKMKTTHSTSDIRLTILEGASQEKFTEIPINFNVNAVFSKYTIVPLRNINFGPMQYGEKKELSFEIKNNGLFPFHYAICDFNDEEAKKAIKAEREKEIKERREEALGGGAEEAKDPKAKKVDPKAAKPGKDAKGAAAAEGEELKVSQYVIRPKTGVIEPDSSASIKVQFHAEGAQFYEKTLAIDISGRDFQDQPEGIKFDLSAESCIPGINTEDLDAVFEEQTVIPSLDPNVNTQSVITSSLYAIQERVFWFGTLIASKVPEGVVEKFKIMNPNKIPCTVNFSVKPRTQSKNEGFAFEVSPASVKIPPHENAYVKVSFKPENMMPYGGIFEAVVEHGDPESNSGKFSFEVRGEGTLPTLLLTKPTALSDDGLPLLKFNKTRLNKKTTGTITLHNEGSVPATVKFKPITHDNLEFKGEMSATLQPKEYYSCDIDFIPTKVEPIRYVMEFETLHNPFERHKVVIQGEGYQEIVTFENLPEEKEDELRFGDAIVKKPKNVNFNMVNTSDKPIRFEWNVSEPGFSFLPSVGHLKPQSSKVIHVKFCSDEPVDLKNVEVTCDSKTITQDTSQFVDWDDSMTEVKLIRPSELKKILAIKEAKERKKKEEAEAAAAAAAKKGKKPPPKKEDERLPEEDMEIDESEEPTEEYAEALPEPAYHAVEGSDKQTHLKASVTADYAKFE